MSGAAFLLGGVFGFMAALVTAVFTSASWPTVFMIYCATSLAITVAWIATQMVAPKSAPQDHDAKAWTIAPDGKVRANG